ncbi:unnamed protein product [Paramecium primaurelia]|uniref:Uncharacterized protein n=1 Tax=Paramecium primaurelia TaxID=5886 RepID=A0A8S1NIR2_PARPR|nr:unnamed protein product [Paramecium primaurelia]
MIDLIIKPVFYFEIAVIKLYNQNIYYKSKESAIHKLYYNSICFLGILNTSLFSQQNVQLYQPMENVLKQIIKLNTQIPSFQQAIQSNFANMQLFQNYQYEKYQYLFGNNNLIIIKLIDVIIRFNNQELIDLLFDYKIFDYLLFYIYIYLFNSIQHHYFIQTNQLHNTIIQDIQRIINQTQILEYLNKNIVLSKNNLKLGYMVCLKKIGYLLLSYLENYEQYQSLKTQLLEFKHQEDSFLLNINLKDCKEIPPIQLSIERQIEMMLDQKNNNNNQNQDTYPL